MDLLLSGITILYKKRNLTSRQQKVWINLASPFTDENKFCDIFVSPFELSPNVITRRRGIFKIHDRSWLVLKWILYIFRCNEIH